MKHELVDDDVIPYAHCRYGASRMLFRGPRKSLDRPYLAFVGGTETYGKYIKRPFPALVEKAMRQPCVNLGYVNGGIDAFLGDSTVIEICQQADLTVVQIMGANLLSNRFYAVHPRRNDRFLRASTVLEAIYHDVDFADFSFTRHMLGQLHATSIDRFETVVRELREAWLARMRTLLATIGGNTMLLWFSDVPLDDRHWSQHAPKLQADPLFINASMIETLRPMVRDVVVVNPSGPAVAQGTQGMHYPPAQERLASELLGADCHREAAAALVQRIRDHLYPV